MKPFRHICLLVAKIVCQIISFEYHLRNVNLKETIRTYSRNGGYGCNIQLKRYIISEWWQIWTKMTQNEDFLMIFKVKECDYHTQFSSGICSDNTHFFLIRI